MHSLKQYNNWIQAVSDLQSQFPEVAPHVGGRTALVLHGYGHYAEFRPRRVFLYSPARFRFPRSFRETFPEPGYRYASWSKWRLFRNGLADVRKRWDLMQTKVVDGMPLRVSCPELAMLEMACAVEHEFVFDEAAKIVEGMGSVNGHLLQTLLENCTCRKVRRVVCFLSKWAAFDWDSELELSRLDLGARTIQVVQHGIKDSTFRITVPREYAETETCPF